MGSSRRRPPASDQPREGERLQKVLAAAGVSSRRRAEELIIAGRVRVDGREVRELGTRVDPARARIEVDGRRVEVNPAFEYWILNKPAGVVTTARDPQGRRTVLDLVRTRARVFPVGRLDADTTGLVLLTNHGELANRLTHPRFGVPRTYLAEVRGSPSPAVLGRMLRGIRLKDGPARARAARILRRASARSQVEIVIAEGRKHEVRRLLDAVGHPVLRLARVGFGPLRLSGLASGRSRPLTASETGRLLEAAGL